MIVPIPLDNGLISVFNRLSEGVVAIPLTVVAVTSPLNIASTPFNVPVNVGDTNGAYVDATSKEVASGDIAVCTKAVVAILVELSPEDCVVAIVVEGKVGVPVKVGDSNGAFKESPGTVGELAVPPRSPAN